MGDGKCLEVGANDFDMLIEFHHVHVDFWKVWKFFLSLQDHERSEVSSIDRWISNALDEEWNTANVVEVTVGNNKSSDFVFVLFKVFSIWKNVVDTRRIVFRRHKLKASIKDEDIVSSLNSEHIFSHFLYTAEWDDANSIEVSEWRYRNDLWVVWSGAMCEYGTRDLTTLPGSFATG